MSLDWCVKHCPRTHHPKGAQPKNVVGRNYWCPVFPDYMGACFAHCNLDSNQICGDCVHWYGHCTTKPEGTPKYNSNGRHNQFGSCPHRIGIVSANWHNDCPYFHKRPDNFDWAMEDWVEDQIEKTGKDPASPDTRPLRIEIRKRWLKMWER